MSRVKTEVIPFYWLIIIIIFFSFNWEQSYLATLFTPKIAQKCLEILLLLYNLHILASDPKKLLLFEKLRETFWKISSNLWKALVMTEIKHTWHWKTNVLVSKTDFTYEKSVLRVDFNWEIHIRISWISFLPFDWKIRKRICKTILVNSGLLFAKYACACKTAVLKDSFSNPFSDFPIER